MIKFGMHAQRVKLRRPGFREMRKSDRVREDLRRRAEAVARAAGPGWVVREAPGVNRARFVILPTTVEASRAAIKDQAGVRALLAGRVAGG